MLIMLKPFRVIFSPWTSSPCTFPTAAVGLTLCGTFDFVIGRSLPDSSVPLGQQWGLGRDTEP